MVRHPPGPAAAAKWLYGIGISEHRLPIFRPWLFRNVTPSLQLAGVLSTRAFRALATRTTRTGRRGRL